MKKKTHGFFKVSSRKLLSALFLLLTLSAGSAFGASSPPDENNTGNTFQQNITGTVTDDLGAPLPGVNIVVEGTSNGVSTDFDGNYSIEANIGDTLIFSYLGFKTKTIEIVSQTTNISLEPDAQQLGEVELVAVGYGQQRKIDLTGSVGSISAAKIQEQPTVNVLQSLSSKVAGLNISDGSGRPGGDVKVTVRGSSSINASNEPLFIIDGVQGLDISLIDPNDIESINILKDASSTAIYGARGSNGVILVTTKKGAANEPRIQYSGIAGISWLSRKVDVLNAEQYMDMRRRVILDEVAINPSINDPKELFDYPRDFPEFFDPNPNNPDDFIGVPKFDTDWQDEASRIAFTQRHNLSISGGGEKISAGMSVGYQDIEGILLETYLERITARGYLDYQATDWLKIGASVNYSTSEEQRLDDVASIPGIGAAGQSLGRALVHNSPVLPVRNSDGTFTNDRQIENGRGDGKLNPVGFLTDETDFLYFDNQFFGNLFMEADIIEGLKFRTNYSRIIKNSEARVFYTTAALIDPVGRAYLRNTREDDWQFEGFLTYNTSFNERHDLSVLAGAQWLRDDAFTFTSEAFNFPDESLRFNNLTTGVNPPRVTSNNTASTLSSYFARVNYTFDDKYLLTVTGRSDGSSRFGANNRRAFFPSAALGWRISEEDFLADSDAVRNLKLRASFGVTGNNGIGDFTHLGFANNADVIFNGSDRAVGSVQGAAPNSDLKWERTEEFNLGVDLSLFGRANLTVDYYNRTTEDLLFAKPLPIVSGFQSILTNIGSVRNRGVEILLNTNNIVTSDFNWSSAFAFTANKNEVLALGDNDEDILFGGFGFVNRGQIMRVGEPVGAFWGFTRTGIWGTDEAAEAAGYGRRPGDVKWLDVDNDGAYTDADTGVIGSGLPDWELGINNTFTYKNWTLAVDVRVVQGADIMDLSMNFMGDRNWWGNSYTKFYERAWTPENQNTNQPRIRRLNDNFFRYDTAAIFDGSFIRGQNLQLTYDFDKELLERLRIKQLSVYMNTQNFFLISAGNYHGFDPEVNFNANPASPLNGGFSQGVDLWSYPKSTSFNIGINITL
jgi:TonB-linked SusC/RagA family outer membrane protein